MSSQPAGIEGAALGGPWGGDEDEVTTGFFYRLGRWELRIAQASVVLMTVLVLTSAISRTVGRPLSWTVDLATFSFAWAAFIGADVALRKGKMVTIDLVVERLGARTRAWLQVVNTVLVAVFLIAMVVLGVWLSYTTHQRTFNGLPWLSYTWVTLSVPVGCALMLYTTARQLPTQWRTVKEGQA